ncbi:MAG: hypothetical protein A2521_09185 [Deltaproteobacteria bacterium RIFOXYD12_FULL_57_12]|nr:MAG: hypothetical protein A2521_09185 [Deltaproteobacteria bacterium RIFOXYD12_FULL_57_12]
MNKYLRLLVLIALAINPFLSPRPTTAEPLAEISATQRCAVCGMFVAKYQDWLAQIRLADGSIQVFDGCKDMLAYVFQPAAYGGSTANTIKEIWVKDYYALDWIDGRTAWYVVGSDIHGPMGHELLPFASQAAAEAFLKDHHGREIIPFAGLTEAVVESLRSGQRMK